MNRPLALAMLLALLVLLAGCTSTGSEVKETQLLTFLPAGKNIVPTSSILHEVQLSFELDRAAKPDEEPVLGKVKGPAGPGEYYIAGWPESPRKHQFSYANRMFLVGEFRYPAERGGQLFILQDRPGPFTFVFRGRKVTIEHPKPWKPAVLYREVRNVEDLSDQGEVPAGASGRRGRPRKVTSRTVQERILQEEIQVGPHRIVAFADKDEWQVDQVTVHAPKGCSMVIDSRGDVRTS